MYKLTTKSGKNVSGKETFKSKKGARTAKVDMIVHALRKGNDKTAERYADLSIRHIPGKR